MAKDQAWERKKPLYAKTKVSALFVLFVRTLVGRVMCLKRLITVPLERSVPFHLTNGRVGAIPTYRVYRLYDKRKSMRRTL